jgi:hypothetical protein
LGSSQWIVTSYNVQARRDLRIYLRSVLTFRRGTYEARNKLEEIKTQAVIAVFKADAIMRYLNRGKNAAIAPGTPAALKRS